MLGLGRLSRFTPAGAVDTSFGPGGAIGLAALGPCNTLPSMLATVDGGTIVQCTPAVQATRPGQTRLSVAEISPGGESGVITGLEPAFGGGLASGRSRTTGQLEQNSFFGSLLARPDGSYLAVGSLNVVRYTGEGEGFSAGFAALAAYTPQLVPDPAFGSRPEAARARVRVLRQRAASDLELGRVLVRVTASGPGLVTLRIRDGRDRILAQNVAPVYAAGAANVRIPLTATGRRLLRRGGSIRVRAGHDFRDLYTERDRGAVSGRLR